MSHFAKVHSRALLGLEALGVTVEVHLAAGLPSFSLVGLAETEVKEARERVRCAIQNANLIFPSNKRITVNLAPADLPKDSGRFDLPIALGILAASGQIDTTLLDLFEFAGELSLAGDLRPVRGALAMGLALRRQEASLLTKPRNWVLPPGSAQEAALVAGTTVYEVPHLLDVVAHLQPRGRQTNEATSSWHAIAPAPLQNQLTYPDMADVKGQLLPKRALEIAAAGGHSVLLMGPPGTGKSMLAQRFVGLLPPMSENEALESAAVQSLAGEFRVATWGQRSFRSPHHTASAVALVGGGSPPRPGEVSLAHHGVLFLDELPEFSRMAIEALREPLECGHIQIARATRRCQFPARFQLIAAMNPCPCGHLGSQVQTCRCTPEQVARYHHKLSGPLLDRIDMQVEVPALPSQELLNSPAGESSAAMVARIYPAHERALKRQGFANSALQGTQIDTHCPLEGAALQLLNTAASRLGWSARSTHRVLKLARTIADLDASQTLSAKHVAEAVQYRRGLQVAR